MILQVYATDGDETLGGSDLDLCLYEVIKSRIEGITGESITAKASGADESGVQESAEACTPAAVRTKAEKLKKELSSEASAKFECRMPSTLKTVSFEVSRNSFETGCRELFDRGMVPVVRLLSDLHMTKDDIDEVVLVGGTTRIPFVKRKLREFFGKALNDHIDPDVTVAYGAASILD
jgi:molecular chaperone DnaK (HSP70)